MTFTKKQILDIIQQEIDWHTDKKGEATMSECWVNGFIAGLKQIKKVFKIIK